MFGKIRDFVLNGVDTVKDGLYALSVKRNERAVASGKVSSYTVATRNKKKRIFIIGMLAFPLAQFLLFYVAVNINSVIMAFQQVNTDTGRFEFAAFDNFVRVFDNLFHDAFLKQVFVNSLIMFAANQLIAFPLSLVFSYYVYKKYFLAKMFRFVLFLPSIISSIVLCLVFKLFLDEALPAMLELMGIENCPNFFGDSKYAFGTMIFYTIWTGFATGLIMYSSAMARIPTEITESAQLDGITPLRELVSIAIPMIFPTITTMLVLAVSGLFTNMGPVYAIYGDLAPNYVYTIGYYLYVVVIGRNSSLVNYPYAAAMGIVFTLVVAPLTLLVKWLLEKFGPMTEY
ncbi:MAG TPA: sugar ABC transporter permease [Candidatus Borkfalkia avicola]|uniref:Sugar ABC transporter permease n=1 Tax=Candidatus Borkfalkia avicola TaxID=2838503 RepID=A0A9D2D662_9FIRM|nr:sugar ABC transporter permease [Candidatus Borkfalkia avicola]